MFQAGYAAFLAGLRGRYPDAHIFCVNINGWPHFSHLVKEVVEAALRNGDEKVCSRPFLPFLREIGCDWHSRVEGHHAIADVLTPVIASTLTACRHRRSRPSWLSIAKTRLRTEV